MILGAVEVWAKSGIVMLLSEKNTLATLMSSIAKKMQLSYQYTNNPCNNHMRILRSTELLL